MSRCPCNGDGESLVLDVMGLGAETVLAFPETYGGLITTPGSRVTLDFPYVGGGPSPVLMTANGQVINTSQDQSGFELPMPDISPLLWVGGGVLMLAFLMRRGRR